jgi:hypothetical protein
LIDALKGLFSGIKTLIDQIANIDWSVLVGALAGSIFKPVLELIEAIKNGSALKIAYQAGRFLTGLVIELINGGKGLLKTAIDKIRSLDFEALVKKNDNTNKQANQNNNLEGCNCFTAGTQIVTFDGSKPIEQIQVGDRVIAKNDRTGSNEIVEKWGM